MDSKLGILLLNLGGPERLEDVYSFLYNLFADPDLLRLPVPPLQKPLAALIAASRSPTTRENYAAIGGGSPLRRITEEQAQALTAALAVRDIPAQTYVAMRYWHPFTEEALNQIEADGIETLVILPLYPQFSISTTGSSLNRLEQLWRQRPRLQGVTKIVIRSWHDAPGYLQAMAESIERRITTFHEPDAAHIFFSAHGVPVKYVTQYGDPYQAEIENCVDGIMNLLRRRYQRYNAHTLAYQSRVGPVEWLRPYTEDAIASIARRGIGDLVVVPISFVSEHIETLQEIDMEYRELAEAAGIHRFERVPALNTDPAFIEALADLVSQALAPEPPQASPMAIAA
ncbi:MAG: ferrochelatase [Oscillatoriales cyanobacterium SM2_1_8]|nr:ferrochelatase [Oscillatoriales cyanobacterium SM2_1_8]